MKMKAIYNINCLCASPTLHLERFQRSKKWTGPSVYFHEKTLERLKELGSPENAVRDRQYQEYLYASLCAWGLHRMGGEAVRLVEFDKFCQELEALSSDLGRLRGLHLGELSPQDIVPTAECLWHLMDRMRLRPVDKPYLVPASKALHHLLPHLVVPIDDKHTAKFFSWQNRWRKKQREMFFEIFPCLVDIAKRIKPDVGAYIGQPFHRSLPKVIDNAIVGFSIGQSELARAKDDPASRNTEFSQPPKTSLEGSKTMDADRIRQKALDLYFEPARQQGHKEVVIISGKLHREVGLRNRYSNVCQALGRGKLQQMANAELLKQEGPKGSSTTRFTYRLL